MYLGRTLKSILQPCRLAAFCILLVIGGNATADRPFVIKVATLAPKGSVYHRVLQDVCEAFQKNQGGNTKCIIYTDASQGTEAATVKRLRADQLQASMMTVAGLKEIVPSVTALQFMPSTFRNWDELDYVLEHIGGDIEKAFEAKGYKVLMWGMGGWVQFYSTKPRMTPDDFKNAKIFSWAGTKDQEAMMISLGFTPVVLDLPDLLAAVQTGMVDVVPVAPMWALTGQIYRHAPYMLEMNWVPIVGATVLSMKAWNKMTPEAREAVMAAAARGEETLRQHRVNLDREAIEAMQERGLEAYQPNSEAREKWDELVKSVWPRIRGTMVPEETFDRVHQLLAEYRSRQ
jgi:TRAP-type C4-dicarboxylate transport system substrate-binding protein